MNEANVSDNIYEQVVYGAQYQDENSVISPMFSIRKLRLIYNELSNTNDFEFTSFEQFKQSILASVSPDVELGKWQVIAARR